MVYGFETLRAIPATTTANVRLLAGVERASGGLYARRARRRQAGGSLEPIFDQTSLAGPMLGPIFGREWLTLPRRSRHYVTRSLYLGGLWVLILTVWQTAIGWEQPATLGD